MQTETSRCDADPKADMELVEGLLAGRDASWREFHKRYDRLIFRCITKVTGRFSCLSQDDVREIYARLLIQLLLNDMHKLRSFDPNRGNRFSSFIGFLAVNAAHDYLRSFRREPDRAPVTDAEYLCSELPSQQDMLEREEKIARVEHVLKRFTDRDREFVALYFAEGLEAEEVAARLQISVKTVYSKKHKIQTRLEQMLSKAA